MKIIDKVKLSTKEGMNINSFLIEKDSGQKLLISTHEKDILMLHAIKIVVPSQTASVSEAWTQMIQVEDEENIGSIQIIGDGIILEFNNPPSRFYNTKPITFRKFKETLKSVQFQLVQVNFLNN